MWIIFLVDIVETQIIPYHIKANYLLLMLMIEEKYTNTDNNLLM